MQHATVPSRLMPIGRTENVSPGWKVTDCNVLLSRSTNEALIKSQDGKARSRCGLLRVSGHAERKKERKSPRDEAGQMKDNGVFCCGAAFVVCMQRS